MHLHSVLFESVEKCVADKRIQIKIKMHVEMGI